MKRKYEIAFVLREGEAGKTAIQKIKEYLSKLEASIISEDDQGIKNLAYTIRRNREKFDKAYYYFVKAEIQPNLIIELERMLKYDENVIRHLLLLEG